MKDKIGSAVITLKEPVIAGSFASFDLIYTAGYIGLDDSGSIKIVQRYAGDMGNLQFGDPTADNFVRIEASNKAELANYFNKKNNIRPWGRTLTIKVARGYLKEGDRLIVHYGDQSGGSPGMRMQTFCEETLEFKVLVDAFATCDYIELPDSPVITIAPGRPARWLAVLPTMRRVGESFCLSLKAEDVWGNPSNRVESTITLKPSQPIRGLPDTVTFRLGQYVAVIEKLVVVEESVVTVDVLDELGALLGTSNPLRIVQASELLPYWGDMHGQSEETIGTNTVYNYFQFARDKAFLDVTCHQGNDFQITVEFWSRLQDITAEFYEPGRFVTFPGYEWSANTGLGGDHNVLFFKEGEQIHRSSHALITDYSDTDTDCHTIRELLNTLKGKDVFLIAHVGGRYAALEMGKEDYQNLSVEIHSAWGTFEWLLHDAFRLGLRVGIVANSDGHKGRPGASYPGASTFGSYGGLTCFLCSELSREAVFESLVLRHHYATSGTRMLIDIKAFNGNRDEALMGDIVFTSKTQIVLDIVVIGSAPIERIDIYNGLDTLETFRPYLPEATSRRIRVVWEGAECRGRSRDTVWDGHAEITGNRFEEVKPINFWNPERALVRENSTFISWKSITTGGFSGFDVFVGKPDAGVLFVDTPLVKRHISLAEIGFEDTVFEVGGLDRRMRIFRLPDEIETSKLALERNISLRKSGDNPLYIRVTQENGHVAWSSPVYLIYRS